MTFPNSLVKKSNQDGKVSVPIKHWGFGNLNQLSRLAKFKEHLLMSWILAHNKFNNFAPAFAHLSRSIDSVNLSLHATAPWTIV
jgi:hypothetical protein